MGPTKDRVARKDYTPARQDRETMLTLSECYTGLAPVSHQERRCRAEEGPCVLQGGGSGGRPLASQPPGLRRLVLDDLERDRLTFVLGAHLPRAGSIQAQISSGGSHPFSSALLFRATAPTLFVRILEKPLILREIPSTDRWADR